MAKTEIVQLMLPVGRLVQGSLYEPQTTNFAGEELVYETGDKKGQPKIKFYFGVAVKKNGEAHWNQTSWGKTIWEVGQNSYPNGQANAPTFAWKITDGDSQIPNKEGRKPFEKPGYAGCWVINLSYLTCPKIWKMENQEIKPLLEKNYISLGDYIEVYISVKDNKSAQSPGVFLNYEHVCFVGYGERISQGIDVKTVGFGKQSTPREVKSVPVSAFVTPANVVEEDIPVMPRPDIIPHVDILKPKIMTAKANGYSYNDFISKGWTDESLIAQGYLQP